MMTRIKTVRSVLDSFCAGQGLPISSSDALEAARQCLVLASVRDYDERRLLEELRHWYAGYRGQAQDKHATCKLKRLTATSLPSEQHKAA
jgi:hypothetical protein